MAEWELTLGKYSCLVSIEENLSSKACNYAVARHSNAKYELFVILQGECTLDVEDHFYELHAGDALLVAPGAFHCPLATSPDLVIFIPSISPQGASAAKELRQTVFPCLPIRLLPEALALCRSIITEDLERKLFWQEAIKARCVLLVTELFRALPSESHRREVPSAPPRVKDRISVIDDFFEVALDQYGNEEQLAKMLCVSRRQLGRILKEHYGVSFRQKLKLARMDRAAWLLRTTDLSIQEIGEAVGYLSPPSFFKAFKAHHNITPEAYRKELISNGSHTQKYD